MKQPDDPTSERLLADFARHRSEADFRDLVKRHLPLVYNTALRVVNGDRHLAEDVAQIVFTDLARKCGSLPPSTIVVGWLHQHTWFTASKMIRTERRRAGREQQSIAMNPNENESAGIDPQIRPMLDEALTGLKPEDRNALVLRFFERADFNRVGQLLGVSEDAAQKRVSRALEKLREVLSGRGVTVTTATLAAALSSEAVALPGMLAQTISAGALAVGAAGSAATAGFFASAKIKAAAAVALAAALSAPLVWQQQRISKFREENQALRDAHGSELERWRADYQKLKAQTVSPEDIARLNKDLLELQRLRGEVTLLRRQYAAATNAAALAHQTEPPAEPEQLQLVFETRVAELTHERMTELLKQGFPAVANPRDFTVLLSPEKAGELKTLLEKSEGVDILSAPKVTTLDGREAAISVTDELPLPTGETLPLGLTVNVLGSVESDRASVNLNVKIRVIEFLRWENEAQTVPRIRTREAEQQTVLQSRQTLVMGRSVLKRDGDEAEPKLQIYCVSSTVINSRGERVVALEQPGTEVP